MRKQILICDDQPNVRESYKLILGEAYDLVFAETGHHALLWVQEESKKGDRPDLVIMDIKMPRMDGLTALKELKKLRPDLPVLVVTGYESVETAAAATHAGAFDYIVKPFDPEQILKAVSLGIGTRNSD